MSECKCDLRTKLVGDGCRYCNPQDYIDHLHDALEQESTWVSLTDEEAHEVIDQAMQTITGGSNTFTLSARSVWLAIVSAVEAKLKEKNT